MVSLGKDPKGETVLGGSAARDQNLSNLQNKTNSEFGTTTTTQTDELAALRERVVELEKRLKITTEGE